MVQDINNRLDISKISIKLALDPRIAVSQEL